MSADYTKVELAQEAFWRRCSEDPVYFFHNYWKIQHPEHGAIYFKLFDAQVRALEVFQSDRYVITLKARQIGWTTLVAAYAFWLTYFHPDRPIIFLSKGEREAAKILKMVGYGFKRLPDWMKSRGPRATRDNMTNLEFDNGSSIMSLPSKEDPARGETCYLVVVDEWASLDNAEDAWASIEPITDVGGRCIGLSTAKGYGNFYHTLWVGAETGSGAGAIFTPIFEPWSARSDRDENWYEAKRQSVPEWILHQEYPTSPEEAFIKSGNPFFDVDKLMSLSVESGRMGNIVDREFRTFVEARDGNLELWELPIFGDKYVIGADVAEGLEWGDYSSAHVKHLRTSKIVAHWHGHIPPDEFADILFELGMFYNRALIGPENNNHGLTTCVTLKALKYPNIFYTRIVDERSKRETVKIGWSTTKKTRPLMLDDLYAALRDDAIDLCDRETIAELRTFVRDENARLHGSPFDDRTISLAITEQMAQYAHQHEFFDEQIEWGSLAWWDQVVNEADMRRAPEPLGRHNVRRRDTSAI